MSRRMPRIFVAVVTLTLLWPGAGLRTTSASGMLLDEASLRNGDYGAGAVINTFPPNHGGSPGVPGVVSDDSGTTFISTETTGLSNGLVNWVIPAADRTSFRTAGTVSFCASVDPVALINGSIFGDNPGFNTFRNGQSTFGVFASRVANAPGLDDDQWRVSWQSWHNNFWVTHEPSPPLEMNRSYRIGLAWGLSNTRFEIWVDGVLVAADNNAANFGRVLPWGFSGSATNFGIGGNHERGVGAYGSAPGVTFSDIRIWKGYQPAGDTVDGCGATPHNQPPVAVDDEATLGEGETAVIDVLANDVDPDGDDIAIVGVTQGEFGTVVNNDGNTVSYSANVLGHLIDRTEALPLNRGLINSLRAKAQAAQASFARGNRGAGFNQLGALANQLKALVRSGRLHPDLADPLIALVQLIEGGSVTDTFTYTISDGELEGSATVFVSVRF